MSNKTILLIKITSLFLIAVLLFSFNTGNAFSAGDLALMQTPCTSWDLATDFRTGDDHENPNPDSCNNPGVWEFMGSAGLTRTPQNYYTLPESNFNPNAVGISGLNVWYGTRGDGLALVGYNASGATQTVGTVTWPANTIDVHPAPDQLAIMAWHSPINGYVSITGGVSDNDPGGGNGIQWFIDKNTSNLASGSYSNGGSQTFTNGSNGTSLNTVSVAVGDVIYVVVDPNGGYTYDSTRVDLSINVTTALTPTPTQSVCNSWNLATDFRISPYQANPSPDSCNNPDVWEYMGTTGLTRDPQSYYTLDKFTPDSNGISNLNVWGGNRGDWLPLIGYNASGATQTIGTVTWPANTIDVHPAPDQLLIVAWQSSVNGYISITGSVTDNDPVGGNGIQWFIDQNTTNLASGSYTNGGSQAFANGTNGVALNTVPVSVGDVIYLAIHPNGDYTYDSTRVDLSINVTNPPTPTPTFTPTSTPTLTPTNTPPPNYGGSGICWGSDSSWSSYSVSYSVDRDTIPTSFGWDDSIHSAAQAWNNVEPSHFTFTFSTTSSNTISYGQTQQQYAVAETTQSPLFDWISITAKSTTLNSALSWDTNNTPLENNPDSNGSTTTYNVQNAMTHEFGHWLDLWDIADTGCELVTMWHEGDPGEIKKISLENADEFAINWQYP